MKASAFRRWPVAGAYSPEQTTRLTGGSDFYLILKAIYRNIPIGTDLSKYPHQNRSIEISPSEPIYRENGGTKAW